MNIFEQASRNGYRYPSVKGELTTEQLWTLPLTSKSNASLDDVAKAVNAHLKTVSQDESFVSTESNPAKGEWETKLEILKHIIAVRLAENEAARDLAKRKSEKDRLLEILDRKQDAALQDLSQEELLARIGSLG